ncbi:hypothetical protein CFD26_104390 [Aspergillus turcosus]|uniref:Uncharacterized protein n=1 Tax=Aspergillus turcosus TaxID=1245748 RepID=A0A3R7FQU2_9EURO|nr:hypothetical protein CFD26_104390 [Aspergillus turcosus]
MRGSTLHWIRQAQLRDSPIPWRWTDGEGPFIPFKTSNKVDMERMAEEWKLVDAVWDYDVWGYPPARTRLSDAAVFKLLVKKIPKRRSEQWPFDFNSRGQMRLEREPLGPTVWIEFAGRYYYPEIAGRYVLGGEVAGMMHSWYIEPPHAVRRNEIYFGRVEVPSWAKDQGAIIVSPEDTRGLIFCDHAPVSWEGRLVYQIIWAKEVSVECPQDLTRATVVTEGKTESGQDAILVDYGSDEEPEDTQDSTEMIDVKNEDMKEEDVNEEDVKRESIPMKSEVVNGSQRFHRPRTLKRKPESPVNTHRKRCKAEITVVKIKRIPIKSEVINGSQEVHLENRTAAEPLITTPQQQSSARMPKREGECRVVTVHNKSRRATSTASTQSGGTEPWVETALQTIRQAASVNREHQAQLRRIREAVTSLQARVDALEASAPLPRALEDVRNLMAEHQDDVRGTAEIGRAMEIILQKLPS